MYRTVVTEIAGPASLVYVITAAERKALLFLSTLIALGSGARIVKARTPPLSTADSTALALQLARVDSVRAKGGRKTKRAKKKLPAEILAAVSPVDLDTASAELIDLLPGVGKAVAARIVANRDSFGAFGSLEQLQRVRGIGPKLSDKLRPHVTFSGVARPSNAVLSPERAPRERRRAPRASRLPGG